MHFVIELFNNYGYIVLFMTLALELIALPLPGEVLMTYCGYLVYMKKMNLPMSILVAGFGAAAGITLSYFIGNTLGVGFFHKHGHYVHMDEKRLDKISTWFEKYGNKLLIIAYFIPGVRHVTGYFSGITKIPYKKFAFNAYLGAFLWTSTFISLGKVLGGDWAKFHGLVRGYLIIGGLIIASIIAIIYIYKSYKQKIYNFFLKLLDNSRKVVYLLRRIKALIRVVRELKFGALCSSLIILLGACGIFSLYM